MTSNCPPQLQLSIQSNTTNFKRSFEEFGFDLESPVGPTDGSGGSTVDNGNERNKRARSSSSFSESSADDSQRSSLLGSGSDSSNSSLSAVEEPPVIAGGVQDGSTTSPTMRSSSLDPPPRLPTPMIQDIDMAEVLPQTIDSELVASQPTQPRHQQVEDRYRLSLERFNAFENEISVLRRSQPSPVASRSPTPPPTLPPLSIVSSSSSLSQVSDEVPSGSRMRQIPSFHQFQNHTNDRIEEEIEVVNGFRERLNSALERLRSASPLVPGLADSGEEVVGQEDESLEEDGDEESTITTPSLPADPPTLPPIPFISVDEFANPSSFLSQNRGLSSNTESTTRPTVADQLPRDLDTARDRISRQQTYMQQRIVHMRRHQQQQILNMQRSIRASTELSRNLNLSDHPLPSPILRDFRVWMEERPPTGETSTLDGISSARTDATTSASQSTDGNINQQREQNPPSHTRPIPSPSHTTVDSGTWEFVHSLFEDEATPSTLDTELFTSSSSLSPTGAAAPGSSRDNPSTSTSNSNSDMPSNSGSVSYNRNLTDEAAVRSLDHGIGVGLGFGTGAGRSGMRRGGSSATPIRHAPLGGQTRSPEERRERLTQGLQGSSSSASDYVHPFFHENYQIWEEYGRVPIPHLELDFSTLGGTAGSATSSPSPPLEWQYRAGISPNRSSSPGLHHLSDFMNPTMSSLDFLSPTAAATAPSNLPVNIRHLWGESSNDRQPSQRVLHAHPSSEIDESPSRSNTSALPSTTSSTSNVTANPSNPSSQMRLRREPQRRHEMRNLYRNEEQLFGRRLAENSDSSPSATDLNASLPSRVPSGPTSLLDHLNTMERDGSSPSSFQRPRLRSFHLQTRPGSSTSLVGENAAEVRRREDYAEITRARLRALLDNPGTQQTVDPARPTSQDGTAARLRSDGPHQVSRTRPGRPSEEPTTFEGANTGPGGGTRSRPSFDTIVQNAWQSIHGLDLPMDDESSTFGASAMNRLFGTRETASTTGNTSSSMDATDVTRNNTNDGDVDMLAVNGDPSDEELSWQTLESDGDFFSWLNLNTDRPAPRPSMAAAAQTSTHRSTEEPYSSLSSAFSSSTTTRRSNHWNEVTRGSGADVSSTTNRRRRYSDIFETEPRSGGTDGPRSASGTNDQSLSDFVPALPSPDLGGSFDAVRSSNHSTGPRIEPYLRFGLPVPDESPHTATPGTSSSASTLDSWPSVRPPLPRLYVDGESRSRSSLWAALEHEPTRDNTVQQSHAGFRTRRQVQHEELGARGPAHAQDDSHSVTPGLFTELRTRLQEQRAQIERLSARNPIPTQNDPHNIYLSAYAPGPFRNTLQHRLNEQNLARSRFIQSHRQRSSPSDSSNPPTIPPLSFGDDNLGSLNSIQSSPRPSNDTPSNSAQISRELPRVLPRPSAHTFESGPQSRYLPRSYASARSALMHEATRDMEQHLRSLRPGDRPSRPSRESPLQTNASPNRNDESNAAQRQHGLPTFPRHRPHSADARPATNPPTSQNARLPQPPLLRSGAGYGRYIALSPHLMHTHSPEEPTTTTTTGHSQAPPNRGAFPGMFVDDDTSREAYPGFMRGRRARPHPHPHEMMFSFGRLGGLRRGRAFGDFMRDEDFDESYESLLTLAQTLGDAKPKSTPSEIIEKLEKGQYKDWATAESDQRCPICLDDYEQSDTVLKLNNCSHWLHQDCLHQWLQTANTCPVCRKSVHGPNAGSRPRAHAHAHHHHHHRANPFSGPSTPFRLHPHPHLHPPHPRRQRSGSNSQTTQVNTSNANVPPPPLPLPSSPPRSPSNADQGNGSNHDDNAPWRRGPRG